MIQRDILESLRLAFSSLRANPLRAALTVLGIMIGIASVVALTAIGTGSQKSVDAQFTSFGSDTITVRSERLLLERKSSHPLRPGGHQQDARCEADRVHGRH